MTWKYTTISALNLSSSRTLISLVVQFNFIKYNVPEVEDIITGHIEPDLPSMRVSVPHVVGVGDISRLQDVVLDSTEQLPEPVVGVGTGWGVLTQTQHQLLHDLSLVLLQPQLQLRLAALSGVLCLVELRLYLDITVITYTYKL